MPGNISRPNMDWSFKMILKEERTSHGTVVGARYGGMTVNVTEEVKDKMDRGTIDSANGFQPTCVVWIPILPDGTAEK